MSKSEKFTIILSINDDALTYQITSKIKQIFKNLPLNLIVSPDGPSVIIHSQTHKPHLIILSSNMIGMNGIQVIREIRKKDGGTPFLYCYTSNEENINESGIDTIKTPITNWSNFQSKIQEVIPEEIKIKYGLLKGDTILHRLLKEYSDKYCLEHNIHLEAQSYQKEIPLQMIHKSFDTFSQSKNIDQENSLNNEAKQIHEPMHSADEKNTTFNKSSTPNTIWLEAILLAIISGITYYLFRDAEEFEEPAGLINLKNIFALITILFYFGFFVSKGLDRALNRLSK